MDGSPCDRGGEAIIIPPAGKRKVEVIAFRLMLAGVEMTLLAGPSKAPAAGGPPKQLVIMLHGVGADGNDLIELARPLARRLPHARFVAPHGPQPCDMAPVGHQWFSLRDRRPAALLAGVQASAPLLDRFIDAELARLGLADHQLALLGFSQGTMMALHVAPRRPRPMAAVLGYSGALLGPELLAQQAASRPPVYLLHGDADEVVPVEALLAATAGLQGAGLPVQWSIRPGLPHGIDPDGIEFGTAFLATAFAEAGRTGAGQAALRP
jgi:phospholipase/carboxylesterase